MAATRVQSKTGTTSPGATLNITLDSNVTAGNLLTAQVSVYNTLNTAICTVTGGGTWNTHVSNQNGANSVHIASAENATGGATTVTITITGSIGDRYVTAVVEEWSGVPTTGVFDVSASNTGTGTSVTTGTTAAKAQNNELVLALVGCAGDNAAVMTGFSTSYLLNNSASFQSIGACYKSVNASGTESASVTLGGSEDWAAAIATFKEASGGTPVGQVAETDAAQPMSAGVVQIGQVSEAAQALPLEVVDFAQFGDIFLFGDDSGNESSMGGLKVFGGFLSSGVGLTIAQVSETDAAQSIAARQSRAIGQVAELNAAQALASPQAKAIGQVAELDSAQAIASAQARAVAQIVETDAAQAVTLGASGSALGQVVENDAAQGLASPQRKAVAQIAETDAAQGLAATQTRAIGQAAELAAATALTQRQSRLIGQAQELDSATAVTSAGALQLAQQQELDAAQSLAASQRREIGQSVETDAAQPVARVLSRTIGQVVEADAAVAVGAAQRAAVGQVLEFDAALAMGAGAVLTIPQLVETDAAQTVQQRLLWQIQLLQEIDALQDVSAPGYDEPASSYYRYDVPGLSLRFDIPGQGLRFDVPSIGQSITLN